MFVALAVSIIVLVLICVWGVKEATRRKLRAAARARYYSADCFACNRKVPAGAMICMHCLAPIRAKPPVESDREGELRSPGAGTEKTVPRDRAAGSERTFEGGAHESRVRTVSPDVARNGKTGT
jgi:hypothetical protein